MRALLDVNVLLALLDLDNVQYRRAVDWLEKEIAHGWASCAITQNGLVRIVSRPSYPNPVSPGLAMDRLAEACDTEHHAFWACDVSMVDAAAVDRSRVHGHRQVTDVYLLALAVAHGGRFATFDRSIPLSAVPGATSEHLVVI